MGRKTREAESEEIDNEGRAMKNYGEEVNKGNAVVEQKEGKGEIVY